MPNLPVLNGMSLCGGWTTASPRAHEHTGSSVIMKWQASLVHLCIDCSRLYKLPDISGLNLASYFILCSSFMSREYKTGKRTTKQISLPLFLHCQLIYVKCVVSLDALLSYARHIRFPFSHLKNEPRYRILVQIPAQTSSRVLIFFLKFQFVILKINLHTNAVLTFVSGFVLSEYWILLSLSFSPAWHPAGPAAQRSWQPGPQWLSVNVIKVLVYARRAKCAFQPREASNWDQPSRSFPLLYKAFPLAVLTHPLFCSRASMPVYRMLRKHKLSVWSMWICTRVEI